MPADHQFLTFDAAPPSLATELATQLANYYAKQSLSRNQWRKLPSQTCSWKLHDKSSSGDGSIAITPKTSNPFHLEGIRTHLIEKRSFDHAVFVLPTPDCEWLDPYVDLANHSHFTDENGDSVRLRIMTPLGPEFPLAPTLDREGIAHMSLQKLLLESILSHRAWLVANSFSFDAIEWFARLRSIVSEAVSLLENTLHQFYYKAKYAPLATWSFDADTLVKRNSGRLKDKLQWVRQVTGNPLNCPQGLAALDRVKTVRNHLQHFDPPVFALTLEDATGWLNDICTLAELAWMLRRNMGALPSGPLIRLLLSPRVKFAPSPRTTSARRPKQTRTSGYATSSEQAMQSGNHWRHDTAIGTLTLNFCRYERLD